MSIKHKLNTILENSELFKPATQALDEFKDAKNAMTEAERKLSEEIETLNNRLALEIRRANPELNVVLTREGKCAIKYKNYNNVLTLKADPTNNQYITGESRFDKRFRRYHGHTLNSTPEILGEAVSRFFTQNYRSLK